MVDDGRQYDMKLNIILSFFFTLVHTKINNF